MLSKKCVSIAAIACIALALFILNCNADSYFQDFETSPEEWTTNNPSRFFWSGNPDYDYHVERETESGYYAYAPVTYEAGNSLAFSFDISIASMEFPGAAELALMDSDMEKGISNQVKALFGRDDGGKMMMLYYRGRDDNSVYRKAYYDWEYSTWYHNRVVFTPDFGECSFTITAGKGFGGTEVASITLDGITASEFLADADYRLAVSDIGDWSHSSSTAIYALDNVAYSSPVPEPATALFLATGLAAVGGFIHRRRKQV